MPSVRADAARLLSILVVEDDTDSADTLAYLVRFFGHTVRVAHTPEGALQIVDGFAPDVILMDIGLPGLDGYGLAMRLCGLLEHRPLLVAVTGFQGFEERSRAAGFDCHFMKPYDPCELEKRLEAYADGLIAAIAAGRPAPL